MTGPLVRRFTRNTQGRDFVVGDVHGCFTKLADDLAAVGFDPNAGDRLFSVGDLVDRGPESDRALDWLALPWFFAVRGNHEDFAIRWPNGHVSPGCYAFNGGDWNIANPPELQRKIAETFDALPVAMEIETAAGLIGIVHADVPDSLPWGEFVAALESPDCSRGKRDHLVDNAIWSRARIEALAVGYEAAPVDGVAAVVVGHTPVNAPVLIGNVLHIDNAAWHPQFRAERQFCILDLASIPVLASHPAGGSA